MFHYFRQASIVGLSLVLLWQLFVWLFAFPVYILPGPFVVLKTLLMDWHLLLIQMLPTVFETILGLMLGSVFAVLMALLMMQLPPLRYWLLPILVISQAIPTFAVAPVLVMWFGYGMMSKIITTMIMVFFPVASNFYDGLKYIPMSWLDLATVMNGSTWRILWHIRLPAALPKLASGLRIATVFAPMGAVIGEWVGASRGLGFLILNANAKLEIPLMFSALFILVFFTLSLYAFINRFLQKIIYWGYNIET